jgi:RNA polymerase sigma-70 factor (ECF subfamily)
MTPHVLVLPKVDWPARVMNSTDHAGQGPFIERLTRAMAAGDEDAFREFHEHYFDRLLRFLIVVAYGDEASAKDALQETYLRVARHVRCFPDEEIFWSWLTVLARSAARDGGRKKQSHWRLLRDYAQALLTGGGMRPINGETEERDYQAMLENSLVQLTPLDRGLVEGKYFQGASVRELARTSRLTEKAVESRLLRARRQLKESLTGQRHRSL